MSLVLLLGVWTAAAQASHIVTWTTSRDGAADGYEVINAFAQFNNKLYAGTGNGASDGDILVFNGTTWSLSRDGATGGYEVVNALIVFNGKLYAGVGNSAAGDGDILVCNPAASDNEGGAANGSFSDEVTCLNNGAGSDWSASRDDAATYEVVNAFAIFNGKLYAGMGSSAGVDGDVLVCNPAGGGDAQTCDNALDWTTSLNSAALYETVNSLAVYNSKLYAGMGNTTAGDGDIIECNPQQVENEGSGTDISDDVTCIAGDWITGTPSFATATYEIVNDLQEFNGYLYAGLGSTAALAGADGDGDIIRLEGATWVTVYDGNTDGLDTVNSFEIYQGDLYAGVGNITAGDGDLLVCDVLSGCEATGDWLKSRDDGVAPYTPATYELVPSLAVFSMPGGIKRLYAGMGNSAGVDGDVLLLTYYQPDGIIDNNGDNTFGASGAGGQSIRSAVASTQVAYSVSVQNDSPGETADRFTASATIPVGWTAILNGLIDETNDAVQNPTSGDHNLASCGVPCETPTLGSGQVEVYTLKVTPPGSPTTSDVILTLTSVQNAAESDSVKATAVIAGSSGPTIPTTLSVVAPAGTTGERQLNLTWPDASNNETGFEVWRAGTGVAPATCSTLPEINYSRIATILRDSTQSSSTGLTVNYASAGLTPATYYCYRVRAIHSSGSSAYRYPTTPVDTSVSTNAAAGTPGTVGDLAIVTGDQRSSSIALTWTAPTPSGSSYDVRFSMVPMGDPPGAGQIDFDTNCTNTTASTLNATRPIDCAVKVINLAAPLAAGTPEHRTVIGRLNASGECDITLSDPTRPVCLLPNTIDYIALKTANGAFVSGMSNLVGGDNPTDGSLSGRTALRNGFNTISVPRTMPTNSPAAVFGDDHGGDDLSRWNSSGPGVTDGCYEASPTGTSSCSPQVGISAVGTALGYFLLAGDNTGVIDAPSDSIDVAAVTNCTTVTDSFAVALDPQRGWNMIGSPFRTNIAGTRPAYANLSGAYLRQNGNNATCKTWADAVTAGWVGNAIYSFNGSSYVPLTTTDTLPALFEPWKGYWLYVADTANTYELVIVRPP